jgi:hypothetical protein
MVSARSSYLRAQTETLCQNANLLQEHEMKNLLVVAVTILALACGGTTSSSSSQPRGDRSLLTIEEINRTGSQDAYTAVQSLRPTWLTKRGTSSVNLTETIKVYLDGSLMGGPDYLRQIPTNSISSIRHLDGLEATQRYGLDHGVGAILVFTRRS